MLQPTREARTVFLLHRHELHAHAFFGLASLHCGARPYLAREYVE